ncbi:biotin synthase auxiliary protein BsaP [Frankia sp. CiP1_Cm_nod2]|uniref:biotin synthase auxiliary protein BsaP n=1 Tax=Frankia sp. CiP1_Cm_nod2 TaxID=2897161 RepID=UPI004044B8CC
MTTEGQRRNDHASPTPGAPAGHWPPDHASAAPVGPPRPAQPVGEARRGPLPGSAGAAEAAFCDRCGRPLADGGHDICAQARLLEPPRFCRTCRRRMIVQITPTGWTASCVEHGTIAG